MTEAFLVVPWAMLLAVVVALLHRQDGERAAWARERAALLERLLPGLGVQETPAVEPVRRTYDEADEYRIWLKRNGGDDTDPHDVVEE